MVPGGFGERGAEGKILAASFARRRKLPYFGICFGMQMATVAVAREAGIQERKLNRIWKRGRTRCRFDDRMDARRRPRTAPAATAILAVRCAWVLIRPNSKKGSTVAEIYGSVEISERHRHRYEVNMSYRERLEKAGLKLSGVSPDGLLPEIVEDPEHPWFIGVQFHPELKSRPFAPHPLFASFIAAAVEQSRLV